MCDFFLIDIDSHCKKTKKNQKQIQFNGKKKYCSNTPCFDNILSIKYGLHYYIRIINIYIYHQSVQCNTWLWLYYYYYSQ